MVALKVLADSDGLLDEVVEVLGDLGGETCQATLNDTNGSIEEISAWKHTLGAEDAEDLGASEALDLTDTLGITEQDTLGAESKVSVHKS